ncbi:MAG: hypothetical protein ACXADB_10495 [Candidatus Hermodarchaeia archaeon]
MKISVGVSDGMGVCVCDGVAEGFGVQVAGNIDVFVGVGVYVVVCITEANKVDSSRSR